MKKNKKTLLDLVAEWIIATSGYPEEMTKKEKNEREDCTN